MYRSTCQDHWQEPSWKKAGESIPSFSLSSPSFPLSCWPSGSFLVEVNKSAMVSADTEGGGPLIGPVSIPAVRSHVSLLSIYWFIYWFLFFRTRSFLRYTIYIPGFWEAAFKDIIGIRKSFLSLFSKKFVQEAHPFKYLGYFLVLGEVAMYEEVVIFIVCKRNQAPSFPSAILGQRWHLDDSSGYEYGMYRYIWYIPRT